MKNLLAIISAVSINCFTTTVLITSPALADPLYPGGSTVYRLTSESSHQEGCFPPCMCPITLYSDFRGTFNLTYTGPVGGLEVYSVDNIHWYAAESEHQIPISGSGTYSISGSTDPATAFQHRMELDLSFGDLPPEHFDSGPVTGRFEFPLIDIVISKYGVKCFDTVIRVVAEPGEGRICGGIAGIPCEKRDEFCKLPKGHCCCDFSGLCLPRPAACIEVWDPVCGCDGLTYDNECKADAAGVSIDYYGACAFKLLGPPNGAILSNAPSFKWTADTYDDFIFYSIFPYAGIGYFPVALRLSAVAFQLQDNWWNALGVHFPCIWFVVGFNTSSQDWEISEPWWFTKAP